MASPWLKPEDYFSELRTPASAALPFLLRCDYNCSSTQTDNQMNRSAVLSRNITFGGEKQGGNQ
jgi:hypothetical protein